MNELVERTISFLRGRKKSYQLTFNTPAGQQVLIDLAVFCRANETCVIPGDRDRSLVLEGRREAFLRIQQHLCLTGEQLFELYSGRPATLKPKE